jgi:predicted tellurium resistance membrane protein TerC
MTVFNVEMADIAFSIDSILAAVAMVRGLPDHLQQNQNLSLFIIYLGGVLGIITMRYVAGFFLVLLEKYKGLAAGAYFLVGWIGLKLIGGGLHEAFNPEHHNLSEGWRAAVPQAIKTFPWEMNDLLFWGGMALIIVASLLYRPREPRDHADRPAEQLAGVDAAVAEVMEVEPGAASRRNDEPSAG